MSDVILVSMPYAAIEHPSIALGYLTAGLKKRGISVTSVNANVLFAKEIGLKSYFMMSNYYNSDLLGEWTFAEAAFPEHKTDNEKYFKSLNLPLEEDKIWRMREMATPFIERLADDILAKNPRIVGCSSMFQQNCASLALLRRIRERAPHVVTVMGGANCESEMGRALHANFDWVDYVFSGECDDLFPDFCERVLANPPGTPLDDSALPDSVFTPRTRADGATRRAGRASVQDLDRLPLPDYDDYFADLRTSGMDTEVEPGLLIETSRGCWWGEKITCTFCGLNGGCLTYRSKRPETAYRDIRDMADKYKIRTFEVVDNILDMKYFDTLLPELAKEEPPYRFLYEIKTNLTREQVRIMSDAGIRWVQPGIEGLHDKALKLLKKGNTTCHNLQLLKWSRDYGVYVIWNYLCDIPGEQDDWHREVSDLVPLIVHLQAPSAPGSPLRFDRFSAYYDNQENFDLDLQPSWTYSHIYPLNDAEIAQQAYFFEDMRLRSVNGGNPRPHWVFLRNQLIEWRQMFFANRGEDVWAEMASSLPNLTMAVREDGAIRLTDTRPCVQAPERVLTGIEAAIYRICDAGQPPSAILSKLRAEGHEHATAADVDRALKTLTDGKTMAHVSGRFLSLAVQANARPYVSMEQFPGGRLLLKRAQPPKTPDELTIADVFGISL